MEKLKLIYLSGAARLAAAFLGLACSAALLTAVLLLFASASGELDLMLAKLKTAPAASGVANESTAKPAPG